MRKNTFFGSVALGIAGLVLAAPLANATGDEGRLAIEPGVANPGQQVLVNANCNWPGGATAKLESKALEPASIRHKGDGVLSGYAKVKANTQPGSWPVSFQCGEVTVRGAVTVKAAAPKPTPVKKEAGQVAVKPKGAADTGGEGDVVTAAPVAPRSGPGTGLYVLGGSALAATAGAGVFAFRRLRKQS